MLIVSMEGIDGCGKSTVLTELQLRFSKRGVRTLLQKIGGFGKTPREQTLNKMYDQRKALLAAGVAKQKDAEDKLRNRIFRIAVSYQIGQIRYLLNKENPSLVLLDRTPFTTWIYPAARNRRNPYLDEIWKEAVHLTRSIPIHHIVILDVSPEVAVARIVARTAKAEGEYPETILAKSPLADLQSATRLRILSEVRRLIATTEMTPKNYVPWDFTPWETLLEQHQLYRELHLKGQTGIASTLIDGAYSFETVVAETERCILALQEKA